MVDIDKRKKKVIFILFYNLLNENIEQFLPFFTWEIIINIILFQTSQIKKNINNFLITIQTY